MITLFVALVTLRPGSSDSAAAIVAISAPTKAKMTITTPDRTAIPPSGAKPSGSVRFVTPPSPNSPSTNAPVSRMKAMIAATLIEANQNSNSP